MFRSGKIIYGLSLIACLFISHGILAVSPLPSPGSEGYTPPGAVFNLKGWKLQIPGPQDIIDLKQYASQYFYVNPDRQMCFWVDCSAAGHTANSEFVRSELRHKTNWLIDRTYTLSARIRVNSNADPDKITVLQIHGITATNDNAPPLLRVALNRGSLYAFVKVDNGGVKTDGILLASNIGNNEFDCMIQVKNKHIIIRVNGVEKFNRDFSFWKYLNYFKAGCYPQAHHGNVVVTFSGLTINNSQ